MVFNTKAAQRTHNAQLPLLFAQQRTNLLNVKICDDTK